MVKMGRRNKCVLNSERTQVTQPRASRETLQCFRSLPVHSSSTMAKSAAQTLLAKAEKKANSSGGWFSSNESKYEEAGDLYQQAANSFKIDKLFKEAGDAFAREAECREKGGETSDAANAWWNASKAYKMGFPDRESCLLAKFQNANDMGQWPSLPCRRPLHT